MRPEGLVGGEVEEWERLKRMPIQVRVFNVMKSWIENYCMDDPEDRGVLMAMKRFAQTTMFQPPQDGAHVWEGRATPILPKTLNSIKLLDVDPLELARQLTIVEARAFCKLMPTEFLKLAWGREGDSNVRRMSRTSNRISRWVAESILREEDARRRVALIKHYIHVADRCRQMNNFNTLISIIAARNFSRYREALHTINPPCVPFLGFYLTDLTFIEEGSPDFLRGYPPGMINFSKRMKTAEVILEIQQYQNVPYFLTVVGELQDFLKKCLEECGEVDEERLYEMSLALEPRER
ncbi:ras guanine nucleotide exchange factor domain-containing protein [Chytridium lagenaria]|nr:ras guanine nucleotide exchange factor domain-containing protein [Chytridium lagenaria]